MIIEFGKGYLLELYEKGKANDRKHRFQPEVVRAYRKTILILMAVKNVTDLFAFNGLNYEVLGGDKRGISSVRIDKKYRLEFTTRKENGEQLLTICTLIDISNHYKK